MEQKICNVEMMIVSCKACLKRYLIDETLIGPQGRPVRCSVCGNSWIQFPEVIDVKTTPPESTQPHKSQSRTRIIVGFLSAVVIASAMGFGLYHFRHSLPSLCPQTLNTLEKLGILKEDPARGLLLENVVPLQTSTSGKPSLVLKGEIVNTTNVVRQLPVLMVIVRGDCSTLGFMKRLWQKVTGKSTNDRCIVDKWENTLTQGKLLPGERLGFETAPHTIPGSASEVTIEF